MVRQAKEGSEIPRSKVNIHQLAAYTAELYEKVGASEKKVEIAEKKSELAEQKIAEMMTVMNEMVSKMTLLSSQIAYMDGFLMSQFSLKEQQVEEVEQPL